MIYEKRKVKSGHSKGFSLIEMILGSAIILLIMTGLFATYNFSIHSALKTSPAIKATFLAEEGLEAVTTMRDFGWSSNIDSLNTGVVIYLSWDGTRFVATTTKEVIDDNFTRSFVLDAVNRDANDDISDIGNEDSGTRKVTVNVDYVESGKASTTTKTMSAYITNLFND